MKKILVGFLALIFVLTGCGVNSSIESEYAFVDRVTDEFGNQSNVYKAYNSTVPKVAEEIKTTTEPQKMSKEDAKRMVLLYEDSVVQVIQDLDDSKNVIIEVSSKEFIESNYNLSFFEVYGMLSLADDLFDFDKKKKKEDDYYSGYIHSSGHYVQNTSSNGTKSIRFGSTTSKSIRGGGPGSGK